MLNYHNINFNQTTKIVNILFIIINGIFKRYVLLKS